MNELLTVFFFCKFNLYIIRIWKWSIVQDKNNQNYFKILFNKNKRLNKKGFKFYFIINIKKRRLNQKIIRNLRIRSKRA